MASRKKSNSPGSRAVFVVMLMALIGVGGFAAYVKMTPGASRVADDLRKKEQVSRPGPSVDIESKPAKEVEQPADKYRVPEIAGTDVKLGDKQVKVPGGQSAETYLVTETFKAMGVTDGRALKVEVKDHLATVEVNQAVTDHGYGSTEEGQLIKALQLALGQFHDVEKFTIIEEGQPIELGHLDLSEPIEVIRA